jgi:ketosteroid isomerase-like protein
VLDFVSRINAHDAESLAELMTKDHVFVDSLGRSFKGREEMKKGMDGILRPVLTLYG